MKKWRRVHTIFNPVIPATAALRVNRTGYNPLSEKITPRLKLPLDHQKYVLAGGIGSGKSTELQATAAQLAPTKLVVLVDLWRHFESSVADPGAIDHLQPAEVVGLLGIAVYRTAKDLLGHDWKGLDQKLADAISGIQSPHDGTPPNVDLARLARGMVIIAAGTAGSLLAGPGGALAGIGAAQVGVESGLALLETVNESTVWEWKIGLRGRNRSSDQDVPVRNVLQATNALMDDIRRQYRRDIVLLIDGLDRVQDPTTFEDLFVESGLIGDLRCDLVTTLDLGLVQRYRSRIRWCRPFDFTYVPVASANAPSEPYPAGIAFFEALAAQRFQKLDIAPPISAPMIQRLAYYSGGRLRDFISLIREVAVNAMLDESPRAAPKHVDAALDDFRRDRENGLNIAHIQLLQSVLDDTAHQLPADALALELMERQLLLAYPNENPWYLPHTILTLSLLKRHG
ncbi:MAG: hypothetical protein AAFV53_20465 [Myxococcota bacterium]